MSIKDINVEKNLNMNAYIALNIYLFRNKLEYYMSKCSDFEKELMETRENHGRDTEDWKKFQADLQTAVRVANDFMTGKFNVHSK